MDLGVKFYKNKLDGFIFEAREGSIEHRSLKNHHNYTEIKPVESDKDPNSVENYTDGSEDNGAETIETFVIDWNSYTVESLKDVAKEMGINGYSSMKKEELIAAITKDE